MWQRHHGSDIVASVAILEGAPGVTAAVWSRSNPTVVVRHPRPSGNVESAKIKADHLARETFHHVCTIETCGDWRFVR